MPEVKCRRHSRTLKEALQYAAKLPQKEETELYHFTASLPPTH